MLRVLILCAFLSGCGALTSEVKPACKAWYGWDEKPGPRPYFKAVECPGQATVVECDDVSPLPTESCK